MIQVDIITSVYNGSKYASRYAAMIKEVILHAQSYNIHINILVVDAGSQDDTVNILKREIVGVDVVVIPGLSLPAARNYGVKRTSSDILLLLDIDDLLIVERFLALVKLFAYDESHEFYFAPVSYFDDVGSKYVRLASILKLLDGILGSLDIYRRNYFVTLGSVLLKRKIFERLSFDPDLRLGEDWIFLIELLEHFKGRRFLRPFLQYYIAQNSASALGAQDGKEKRLLREKMEKTISVYKPNEVTDYRKKFEIYEMQFELSKTLHSLKFMEVVEQLQKNSAVYGLRQYGLMNVMKLIMKYLVLRLR